MRILFLHSSSDLYGASRILVYTIRAFKKNKIASDFHVCLSEGGPLVQEFEKLGCKVHLFELAVLRKKYLNPLGIFNRAFFFLIAFFRLSRLIRNNNIDAVYSNTTAIIVGAFAAFFMRKRHVFHIHEIFDSPKYLRIFLRFLMKHLTRLNIMVSQAVYSNWVRDDKKLALKSIVIYNGIEVLDGSKYAGELAQNLKPTKYTIGMIGRVHYWKGQKYFLEIAAKLVKSISDIKFVMIGDAYPGYEYLYDEISILKRDLDLENVVFDLGFQEDPIIFLKDFDLLVLPSIRPDPFPTVILESMSLGVPVAATRHGGALEMIENGRTGWHVPFDDSKAAAEIILKAIQSEQLKEIGLMGKNKLLNDFSIDAFENNISNAIKKF